MRWSLTSIRACRVWESKAEVQVSRNELYTHIHLNYMRVNFLSFIYIYKRFAQRNEYIFIDQDWCNASEIQTAIYLLACVHT